MPEKLNFKKAVAIGTATVAAAIGIVELTHPNFSWDPTQNQIGQQAKQTLQNGYQTRENSIAAQEGLPLVNTGINSQGDIVVARP